MKRGVVTRARPSAGPHPAPGDSDLLRAAADRHRGRDRPHRRRRARERQGRPRATGCASRGAPGSSGRQRRGWGPVARPPCRMKLITAHRILIGAASRSSCFFAVVELADSTSPAATSSTSCRRSRRRCSIAVGHRSRFYFRTLARWGKRSRGRAVLIYDAECAMCRASALWLMRRAAVRRRSSRSCPCRSPACAASGFPRWPRRRA